MTFLCLKIPLFRWKFRSVRSVRYVRYHYVHTTYGCVCCKIIDPKFPVKSRNFGLFLRSKPLQVPSSTNYNLSTKVKSFLNTQSQEWESVLTLFCFINTSFFYWNSNVAIPNIDHLPMIRYTITLLT